MAATVSPWSKPGAWALDAEEHEAELLKQKNDIESASDFPTLTSAAATTKTSKKKKKGQTVSLSEFTTYGGPKPAVEAPGLTPEDLMMLPKGPRERTEEELERGGRGFRSFDRPGRGGGEESRWGGSGRAADRERGSGGGRDGVRDLGPSRADEVDNWASAKKSPASFNNGYERRERDGGRDRGGFFDSKADESDNWVSNKSYAPPPSEGRRFDRDRRGGGGGGGFGSSNGGADSDFWGKKREESQGPVSESGAGSGRPRLNLQPRTLPVAANGGSGSAEAAKPKGANPFGAARPREEVLAEKGQDWKKIDEQLDSMKIKEASERGGGFGKRSFGSGNGRSSLPSERTETPWRKPEANGDETDAASQSAEKDEKDEDEPAVEEQN